MHTRRLYKTLTALSVGLLGSSPICDAQTAAIQLPLGEERFVIPTWDDGVRLASITGETVYVSCDEEGRGFVFILDRDAVASRWVLRMSPEIDTSKADREVLRKGRFREVEVSAGVRKALKDLFAQITSDARYGFIRSSTGSFQFRQYLKVDVAVRESMIAFSEGTSPGSEVEVLANMFAAFRSMIDRGAIDEASIMGWIAKVQESRKTTPQARVAIDGSNLYRENGPGK